MEELQFNLFLTKTFLRQYEFDNNKSDVDGNTFSIFAGAGTFYILLDERFGIVWDDPFMSVCPSHSFSFSLYAVSPTSVLVVRHHYSTLHNGF